jgi:hypothetical protein
VGDRAYTLHISDLGPHDDLVSRRETGLPVTPFFAEERFGMDSLLIMFWMARRKNGEDRLRFEQVVEEFPTYESISEADFKVEAIEEIDGEDNSDPLSSAGG